MSCVGNNDLSLRIALNTSVQILRFAQEDKQIRIKLPDRNIFPDQYCLQKDVYPSRGCPQ